VKVTCHTRAGVMSHISCLACKFVGVIIWRVISRGSSVCEYTRCVRVYVCACVCDIYVICMCVFHITRGRVCASIYNIIDSVRVYVCACVRVYVMCLCYICVWHSVWIISLGSSVCEHK